jgi:CRISPR system Cascade subunit CasD
MIAPYILLWLEGPLQSWGYDSRFGRRDTLDFPTKSGVLGLICCALGAGGEQTELLAEFAELDMQVEAYVHLNNRGKPAAREPLLRDFHMVGSGYDEKDPWQNLLVPKKSDGKKAVGGGSKLTYRYYIQDMAFGVALQVPAKRLQEVTMYMLNPVWDLYLGRKTCVPTELIFRGDFTDAAAALVASRQLAREKNRVAVFRVLQGRHEGEVLTINDVPLRFGTDKRYRDRMVTIQNWIEDNGG